jgi:large conductance mechanosensitive channel
LPGTRPHPNVTTSQQVFIPLATGTLLPFAPMKGFRDFLLRGSLIELAVAFIMGVVFAAVVEAFTRIVLDILGLIVRVEGLSGIAFAGINVGNFLTALITFLLTALVLYFAVVVPYNKLSDVRKKDQPEKAASSEDLLAEIRDLLRERA